ncbi:glycine N-acyltransferase-like protein 3 isoform 2-T2 [Polymixia lowei]
MYVLDIEEMKTAQEVLKKAFPHSIKGSADREGDHNIHSLFSRDQQGLRQLLSAPGLFSWETYSLLAGVDLNHIDAVKELATLNEVPSKVQCVMHVMMLTDISQLNTPKSRPVGTLRSLTSDDAELVNKSWKHGGNRNSLNSVQSYISNQPSLCVTAEGEQSPASWLLVYNHCALGLLYTQPQHRNRGYGKLLVSTMARTLLQEGYPVYCFVEEGNDASFRMFRSLGFTEEPTYRSVWFEVNSR